MENSSEVLGGTGKKYRKGSEKSLKYSAVESVGEK